MKYTERKEYTYDPAVFQRRDVQTALKIYDESVRKHSARPTPRFFEVDRSYEKVDPLWHVPADGKWTFSRSIDLPAINTFPKNDWRLTALGLTPQRRDMFTVSHLSLHRLDYFPIRGDLVWWNGYRYMVVRTTIPGEAYWQQTNIWLGLVIECAVPPEGDRAPIPQDQLGQPLPIEQSSGGFAQVTDPKVKPWLTGSDEDGLDTL